VGVGIEEFSCYYRAGRAARQYCSVST
jgi:hypothetical protein